MHQAGHEETNFRDLLGAINLYFCSLPVIKQKLHEQVFASR
jgi:hypothetical protein